MVMVIGYITRVPYERLWVIVQHCTNIGVSRVLPSSASAKHQAAGVTSEGHGSVEADGSSRSTPERAVLCADAWSVGLSVDDAGIQKGAIKQGECKDRSISACPEHINSGTPVAPLARAHSSSCSISASHASKAFVSPWSSPSTARCCLFLADTWQQSVQDLAMPGSHLHMRFSIRSSAHG